MLKRPFRRVERAMVGVVMAVMALVLEKVVVRSARKAGRSSAADPSQIKAVGNAVEMPES